MNFNIAVIPGDGIGPEVIDESIKVLNKIGENTIIHLNLSFYKLEDVQ